MNLEPLAANAVDPCPSASSVSIIIPTRNRCATLTLCLNALPAGTREVPSLEVIVADDCSSDDTRKAVEEFRDASGWKVIYLRQERPMGANAARNAALNVAGGETIVFIDDDVLVTEGWLYKLLAGLSKECPVVSGPVQLTLEGPMVRRHREEISSYLSEILSPPHGRRGEIVPAACNMAAYRSVFNRARFDETVRPPSKRTTGWNEPASRRDLSRMLGCGTTRDGKKRIRAECWLALGAEGTKAVGGFATASRFHPATAALSQNVRCKLHSELLGTPH